MWQAIELREIRVFLVLAEELHFGRTAERVGLTQSRVSQSIRALERKLSLELAHRTSRRVTLTVAGQRFREEAAAALAGLEEVLRSAQAASGQLTEPVRLGVTNAAAVGPRLRSIIAAFWTPIRAARSRWSGFRSVIVSGRCAAARSTSW